MAQPIIVSVHEAAKFGIIADMPPHELPFNAWTDGRNIRMRDGAVEKMLGYQQRFDPPSVVPYFLLPVRTSLESFWLYAGLAKVYAWDDSVHTNITRQTLGVDVDYSATADLNWTGGVLGGIPVLNNGADVPQAWSPPTTATKLAALVNWPASTICGAMRTFKQYLIALDITKAGPVRYPQMVKWSHPAAAGALPSSWDETDPTVDAGEHELKETDGACIDCLPLGDINVIYKQDSAWYMQHIAGSQIFRFGNLFQTLGILSRRCVVEIPNRKHAVFALDDLAIHDGRVAESILDKRMRKHIFATIDEAAYVRSFVAMNYAMKEVQFCYPETGNTMPNIAVCWNYGDGSVGVRDLPLAAHIASGRVSVSAADTWDAADISWDENTQVWDETVTRSANRKMLMADTQNTKLQQLDFSSGNNGSAMTAYVERTGLGFPFRAPNDPPDFSAVKFLSRLWPRITGTTGTTLNVYCGSQDKIDGAVTWRQTKTFTIGSSDHVDFEVPARLHAIKFESVDSTSEWRLHGYEVEVGYLGKF